MKKEKYDLAKAIHNIFIAKDDMGLMLTYWMELQEQTGLSEKELQFLICQNQTFGQAKYCILGLMDKKKLNSTHIL